MNLHTRLIFLFTLMAMLANAASPDSTFRRTPFVWASIDHGNIAQTNDHLKGDNKTGEPFEHYNAYTIGVAWQTAGEKDWHHVNNFPAFGVGFYKPNLDGRSELGRPFSIFGTLKGAMARFGNNTFGYNIEFGAAFHWKPYDYASNPYNITIGSKASAHIGLGLSYSYLIANRLIIGADAGFTHFSNGAMRKPNKGLNLTHISARVAYLLEPQHLPQRKFFEKEKNNSFDFTIGYGAKSGEVDENDERFNYDYYKDIKYHVVTLQTTFLHQYCQRGKYGGGVSIVYDDFYDSAVLPMHDGEDIKMHYGDSSKRLSLGLFVEHQFVVGQVSFPTQLGYYVYQPDVDKTQKKKDSFQRAGLRYTLPFNAYFGVNIYAHQLSKADFIEWNVGYNLRLKSHKQL